MKVEGRNPVYETLKSDKKVSVVYIQRKIVGTDKIRDIISLANKKGIRIRKVGQHKLKKMSRTKNHQGVIAITKYEFKSLKSVVENLYKNDKHPYFVMFNEVLYQQNLGAIIRTAECAGCTGVIVPKKTRLTPEAVRASMGATEHIPIIKENIFNAIKYLKQQAVKIVGIEASGQKSIYETDLRGPFALLVGGEHSGITEPFLKKCDHVLKIPLFGKISSLNMSNAAAVTLFEKVRQELNS